jgi:alpha-1,3-mannosyltransferase
MRILQVARQFYPKVGGIETCALNLSRGLVSRGHHVEVVTLNRDLRTRRLIAGPNEIDSIPIYRIPFIGSSRYPIAPAWFRFIDKFDVIHIHGVDFFVDSAAAARFLGLNRKPVVITTHGGIFHTNAWRRVKDLYWRYVLARTLEAADAVIAVSDNDAQLFKPIVSPDKLMTIPNGVDPIFASVPGSRVRGRLVSIGRVARSKAIERVIQLLARLANEFPQIELAVAGPDEDGAAEILRQESERLGVALKVRILGELPPDALATLVASAHVFVSAATHEGFGITTVEALSAGVPVLVTHTGVHNEIVRSGENGWFWSGLPDDDATATLRQALLLPNARLDEMRVMARATAAPFDWNVTTEKYERVFESLDRKNPR